jgi:hypothetical protein
MRPHGRVSVNAGNPRAAGRCDRCGFLYNLHTFNWQYQWAGLRLQNLRILVCDRCLDRPQRQLGAKIIPPDPVPIPNARPEPFTFTGFSYDESNIIELPFTGIDGVQLLMPDGVTVILMPDNPSGN